MDLGACFQEFSIHIQTCFGTMHRLTCIVQHSEQTWGLGAIEELTHNAVVEERNRRPLNTLALILLLFSLKRQVNENLLKLFIHIVDT